jgi:hypothetical protein
MRLILLTIILFIIFLLLVFIIEFFRVLIIIVICCIDLIFYLVMWNLLKDEISSLGFSVLCVRVRF